MAKWCYRIKLYRRKSTAQDVQIQQRGNHDELLQDLVDLTTKFRRNPWDAWTAKSTWSLSIESITLYNITGIYYC